MQHKGLEALGVVGGRHRRDPSRGVGAAEQMIAGSEHGVLHLVRGRLGGRGRDRANLTLMVTLTLVSTVCCTCQRSVYRSSTSMMPKK